MLPLIHDDKSYGVLVVANPANGQSFTQMDFSLICSLAEQAALAIKNSDALNLRLEKSRIDSDLHLASEVQELFPNASVSGAQRNRNRCSIFAISTGRR